jgi:uncharacterized protein YecE (DUF72 family)
VSIATPTASWPTRSTRCKRAPEATLYAGSSGFSYPSWKGGFYPSEAKPGDFLHVYAGRLPSVELNTTFYRLPAEAQFERWAAQTPPHFRFALTMTRGATSFGRVEGIPAFVQTAGVLGERLGPVRIKIPQARDDGFLLLLLDSLSPEVRWALDFRHESWSEPDVDGRLAERGVARVGSPGVEDPFAYLRLRDPPYDEAGLEALAAEIQPLLSAGKDVYCYFRHEDEPTAPRYAERLLELVGRSSSR